MKDHDKLERLEEYVRDKEIEDGIRKGLTKWAHTICMTATSAIMGAIYWIGGFIYDKWHPLQAAIKAFLEANKP